MTVTPASSAFKTAQGAIIPRATYRLQLHAGFDFAAATALLPYLERLGISHVYCSPIFAAQPGSLHGYDVIDPTRVNPELGGPDGFERFADAARARGLGLILDLVPNHMGIAGGHNPWWNDVLRNGRSSRHARVFDIDWTPPNPLLHGKVMVPVLGETFGDALDSASVRLDFDAGDASFALVCGEVRYVLEAGSLARVLGTSDHPQLQALAAAFGELPRHDSADPGDAARRAELQPALQERLRRLMAADPSVPAALQACVTDANDPDHRERIGAIHDAQAYRLMYWRSALDDINYRRFFDIDQLAAVRVEDPEVFETTHALALELAASGRVDGLRIDHPDGLHDPALYFRTLQRAYATRLTDAPRARPADSERGAGCGDSGDPRGLYVVVEKIEASHEQLPEDWPVHGTTGYRFGVVATGLFVERHHAERMEGLWREFVGWHDGLAHDGERVTLDAKREIARGALGSPLTDLAHRLHRIALGDPHTRDHGFNSLRDAIAEVAAAMPVYRTYVVEDAPASEQDRRYIDAAVAHAMEASHAFDRSLYRFLHRSLLGETLAGATAERHAAVRDFAMRFQQYSAPVAARGVEDTAFYRYLRLSSLNEVGGEPVEFGASAAAFHAANRERATLWPHTMLATSTHDNKRSEDVRLRIHVLSERPDEWQLALRRWRLALDPWREEKEDVETPSAAEQYLLLQTLLGSLPVGGLSEATLPAYRERIEQYMLKAVREAKLRTTWADQDSAYEQALVALIRGVLARVEANPILDDLQAHADELAWYGALNACSLTVLKYTTPGVPDLYQGTEVMDLSLVDPDNRRPVDHALHARMLADISLVAGAASGLPDRNAALLDGRLKLFLIWRLLSHRRRFPHFFATADYVPLRVRGARRRHALAYARRSGASTLIVVVGRKFVSLGAGLGTLPCGDPTWGDTTFDRPEWLADTSDAVDLLGGARRSLEAAVKVAPLFGDLAVAVLWVGPDMAADQPAAS